MAKPFNIDITARDRTQAGIRSAEQRFKGLQQPLDRLSRQTDRWGQGTAMARVMRGLTGIAGAGASAAGSLGAATIGTVGLGTAASVTSWALGGLVGAAVLATAAGSRFGVEWSRATTATTRAARSIGINAQDLHKWQIAGRLAGVEAEAMTAAMQNVGDVFNDAAFGRNPEAQGMLRQLGIGLKRTKDGAIDVQAALVDIARAMEGRSPQTQRKIAQVLGVEGILGFLARGPAAVQRDLNEAIASGAIVMDDQRKSAEELDRAIVKLTLRWEALKNSMTAKWVIPWLKPAAEALGGDGGFMDLLTGMIGGDPAAKRAFRKKYPWLRFGGDKVTDRVGGDFGAFMDRIWLKESRNKQFYPNGRTVKSPKGAIGVSQMLPATAEATARKHGIPWSLDRLYNDEAYNRKLGRLHMWDLLQRYNGSEVLAAAAYNAGPGRLDGMWEGTGSKRRWKKGWLETIGDPRKGQISEAEFADRIPFAETRDYVAATAGVLQPAGGGKSQVDVTFRNAPTGMRVEASGDRGAQTNVKVERALQDAD